MSEPSFIGRTITALGEEQDDGTLRLMLDDSTYLEFFTDLHDVPAVTHVTDEVREARERCP
jgi:hypothetical protein